MLERYSRAARPSLLIASVALATVIAGCVAAPGASIAPSQVPPSSAPPSQSPSGSPSPSDSIPPGTSPSANPSTEPSSAGCGVATWSTGAKDLVLRLALAGGFVPPGVDMTNVPVVSVYGDGRVISQGPQIMIYPGPLLPSLQVQVLTEAGMRKLLDAAAEGGLLVPDVTYESHGIADAPTSFFTLIADGCTHHVNAYALTESEMTTGLDEATIKARAKLLVFRNQLTDLTSLVGAENIRGAGLFEATSYRIVSRVETPENGGAGSSASPVATVAWPLKTSLATFGEQLADGLPDMRCGVADGADGADAAMLKPLFEKANAETHWTSGGKQYYLMVRPLLPDESGCQ